MRPHGGHVGGQEQKDFSPLGVTVKAGQAFPPLTEYNEFIKFEFEFGC